MSVSAPMESIAFTVIVTEVEILVLPVIEKELPLIRSVRPVGKGLDVETWSVIVPVPPLVVTVWEYVLLMTYAGNEDWENAIAGLIVRLNLLIIAMPLAS